MSTLHDCDNKNRKIAIAATALLHLAVLLILVFSCLHYHFEPLVEKKKESEITFFGSEYVMLGDALSPNQDKTEPEPVKRDPEPQQHDNDLRNSGISGNDTRPTVAQEKHESPMKVEKKPEKPEKSGPTKEEIAEQERIKAEKEARRKTNSKVQNAFGKSSSSKNGSGSAGSTAGNSNTGARTGAPGVSGLTGYTIDHWERPSSPVEGKVVIKVRVNSRGRVIAATYQSGSGTAAGNTDVRRNCERAALKSSFSVPVGAIDEAVGYLTYIFR